MGGLLKELEKAIFEQNLNCYEYTEFSSFDRIDEGGFGAVYKSEWKNKTGLMVALKSLKVDTIPEEHGIRQFVRELQLLQKVSSYSHPNIIKFYGVTKDQDGYYKIILQFAEDGNLRDYLNNNFARLEWTDKFRFAREIAQGLSFLHSNNIAHRDLHPKNILVHERRMMIADFGLSKQINETALNSNSAIFGMPAYIEPQCLDDPKYRRNKKSDIYSFGFILWEISSGRMPFQSYRSADAIHIQIYQGNREDPINGTPKQYADLYTLCWDENPLKRPDIEEVLEILNKPISMNEIISNDRQYLSTQGYNMNPSFHNIQRQRNTNLDIFQSNLDSGVNGNTPKFFVSSHDLDSTGQLEQ